jgi:hypothetical protein
MARPPNGAMSRPAPSNTAPTPSKIARFVGYLLRTFGAGYQGHRYSYCVLFSWAPLKPRFLPGGGEGNLFSKVCF